MKTLIRRFIFPIFIVSAISLLTFVVADLILHFTRYKSLLPSFFIEQTRYYYVKDDELSMDIKENFPKKYVILSPDIPGYYIWSNNIGCFDYPYNGEDNFILLVGDSFTWGLVPFEYNWGTILEKLINTRILKCGVCSFGTKQEMLKAKKIISKIKKIPRYILVGYYINDILNDWFFPSMTVVDGYLTYTKDANLKTGKAKEVDPREKIERYKKYCTLGKVESNMFVAQIKCFLWKNSILYNMILKNWGEIIRKILSFLPKNVKKEIVSKPRTDILEVYYNTELKWINKAWEKHKEILSEFIKFSQSIGSEIYFIIIPAKEQVYPEIFEKLGIDIGRFDIELPQKRLRKFFTEKSVPFLDLLPIFRKYASEGKKLYWPIDRHLNIEGNKILAQEVYRFIKKQRKIEEKDKK